jgi:hypothetical protein
MDPMKIHKKEYTFGFRRNNKAFGHLGNQGSTKETVGPTTYYPNYQVSRYCMRMFIISSQLRKNTNVIFTQDMRFRPKIDKENKNQTYALYSSIGTQVSSKKKTEPKTKFSKSKRNSKRGFFSDPRMPCQPKIRLNHARY